jgi:formate-dependent nitrite reductase membrane component NrfD
MSTSDVTRQGLRGLRPGREASPGREARHRGTRGEQAMVPRAEFTSYYGKPVINAPVWQSRDIAGYFFLGGLAGASSLLGAGAHASGRPALATAAKTGAFGAACVSLAGLVHDLGRPARFLNMMRVFKVTSPMSVGTWILGSYVPVAGVAATSALTGRAPRLGAVATAGAALLGPALATYTGVLISDTAVPAWHDGYREMPFVFAGSAAAAAGGLGLLTAPAGQNAPAGNLALLGAAAEAAAFKLMTKRMGMVAEPFTVGRARVYLRAGQALSAAGAAGALLGRRNRVVAALSGAALLGASAATRWSVFHAGLASAADPKYTVVPQRERRDGMKPAPGEEH